MGDTLLAQLKGLVNQIDDCGSPGGGNGGGKDACGCCPGYNGPFATVTMTVPPPILAPTAPQPVKPLQLPCPMQCNPPVDDETANRTRYANFYNNYNQDWHLDDSSLPSAPPVKPIYRSGLSDNCEDYLPKGKRGRASAAPPAPPKKDCSEGCPTGFKPCSMKLTPPPGCHPNGVWNAQIQPCPPKNKKTNHFYQPGPCTRPCCKHWKPKDKDGDTGPCLYDAPCKAHCFNHPPGMKPSGRHG